MTAEKLTGNSTSWEVVMQRIADFFTAQGVNPALLAYGMRKVAEEKASTQEEEGVGNSSPAVFPEGSDAPLVDKAA